MRHMGHMNHMGHAKTLRPSQKKAYRFIVSGPPIKK